MEAVVCPKSLIIYTPEEILAKFKELFVPEKSEFRQVLQNSIHGKVAVSLTGNLKSTLPERKYLNYLWHTTIKVIYISTLLSQ